MNAIERIKKLSFRLPDELSGLDGKNRAVMLDDVIDILEESDENGWIFCKDRLPDNDGIYLITSKVLDKTEVQYVFYQNSMKMFICNGRAIAWRDLPDPCKE